jgi:hypothetical protein
MDKDADSPAADVPGYGFALLGLAGASVPIAVVLTALMGSPVVYPIVFVCTLAIVGPIGGGAFLLIRDKATWWRVGLGGFATGALVPGLLVLVAIPDYASSAGVATVIEGRYTFTGWAQNLVFVGGFGLLGVVGAIFARTLILWLMKGGAGAKFAVSALIAISVAAMWLVPAAAEDRSCHNPLRDGRDSISPVAGFNLHVSLGEWSAVQDELDLFANVHRWQRQADVRPDQGFPWFQVSLCREPGTNIFITKGMEADDLSIFVFQPQGGDSWEAPLRRLQEHLERRWPGRTSYGYGPGASPRPPWAPPSPEATTGALRAGEKSL